VTVFVDGHLSVDKHLSHGCTPDTGAAYALNSYCTAGYAGLARLVSGSFVIIVLDGDDLILMTDPCNGLPLFWTKVIDSNKTTIITSTSLSWSAAEVRRITGRHCTPNKAYLKAYISDFKILNLLKHGCLRTASPFEEISCVPGGCILHYDAVQHSYRVDQYWHPDMVLPKESTLTESLDALDGALQLTVRECQGYNRVAISLSGGVDSGLVAAYAARELANKCVCITAESPSWPELNETYARHNASALGLPHVTVDADSAIPFTMITPEFVYQHGIPINLFYENLLVKAEAAHAEGATIILTGVGGDELFGLGNSAAYLIGLLSAGRLAQTIEHTMGWTKLLGVGPIGVWSQAFKERTNKRQAVFPTWICEPDVPPFTHLDPAAGSRMSIKKRVRQLWHDEPYTGEWSDHSAVYSRLGIISLHPFYSRYVMEACYGLPQHFIQHYGEYKWLLKRLAERGSTQLEYDTRSGNCGRLLGHGTYVASERILGYFEDGCELVATGVVLPALIEEVRSFMRDPWAFDCALGGQGNWIRNAIVAEMWLRGFLDEVNRDNRH
jgi:asparagine synthetase B (glutamine-hydrolysing)